MDPLDTCTRDEAHSYGSAGAEAIIDVLSQL